MGAGGTLPRLCKTAERSKVGWDRQASVCLSVCVSVLHVTQSYRSGPECSIRNSSHTVPRLCVILSPKVLIEWERLNRPKQLQILPL